MRQMWTGTGRSIMKNSTTWWPKYYLLSPWGWEQIFSKTNKVGCLSKLFWKFDSNLKCLFLSLARKMMLILTSPALAGWLSWKNVIVQETYSNQRQSWGIINPTWRGRWWCRWWRRTWPGWWLPPPGWCGPCSPLARTPGTCFLK